MIYIDPSHPGSKISFKPQYENFIGGKWVPPVKGQYFDNVSPITGKPLCKIPRSTAEDIELALDAAHAAKDGWGKTPVAQRARILNKIADRMEEHLETIAVAETWDNGKPVRETLAADIPLAIDHFRYFASCIRAQEGSLGELDETTVAYQFHEPLGVVGQIIPWNFPILMAVWKLAPALAAGNCVVLKPAEQTPAGILVLLELVQDLLPPGILNVVNGFGLEAGKPLASNKREIAKIAFTGETTTGRLIMQYAAQNIIPGHPGVGRQVTQYLFRGCLRQRRRVFRQGRRGLCHVCPEPGRGLYLPVARAGPGIDLREIHGESRGARQENQARQSPRHRHHDWRPGVVGANGKNPLVL